MARLVDLLLAKSARSSQGCTTDKGPHAAQLAKATNLSRKRQLGSAGSRQHKQAANKRARPTGHALPAPPRQREQHSVESRTVSKRGIGGFVRGHDDQIQQLAAAGSDDDDDGPEDFAGVRERLLNAGPSASYAELVGLFAGRGGHVGAALKHQRRQQEGGSDTSDGDGSEDDSSEASQSDDEGESEEGDGDFNDQLAAAKEKDELASAEDGAASSDVSGDVSEEPDTGGTSLNSKQLSSSNGNDHADKAAAQPVMPALDTWSLHWSRQLSDADAAALQPGNAGSSCKFQAAEHADFKGVWPRGTWQVAGRSELPSAPATLVQCAVKERLRARWAEAHQVSEEVEAAARIVSGKLASTSGSKASRSGDFADARQRAFFGLCNSYSDVLLTARPYPTNRDDTDAYMDAYLLHALNHVAKTADCIKKHNERLQAQVEAAQAASASGSKDREAPSRAMLETPRDQRNLAFKAICRLVQLALRETRADSVQGKEKLVEQFTNLDTSDDDEADDNKKRRVAAKPAEHTALFSGNLDDHFRVGIKITRGAIRLFADLFQADIIVASPIALATRLAESEGRAESDFLSSIELLVIDRADMLIMQNWAHVETVVEKLNQLPREQHGVDIMRVREPYLAGQARHYRQTLLLSSFATPDMNALLSGLCSNHAGVIRLKQDHAGVLPAVVPQVQQTFERYTPDSPATAADARFEYFCRAVWPRLREGGGGALLVVPHYFDYVRLRNFFVEEDASFAALCEYSKPGEVTRARARFFHRQRRMLLYTERAHFYHRYSIRGIKDIVFYSLPEHAHYYAELVNLLEAGGAHGVGGGPGSAQQATVSVMYCKFDIMQLERVVGTARARKMLAPGTTGTFMFC